MTAMPAALGRPPFGPKDLNGSRTMPASLGVSGQQQRLLRASQVIGRSGGDRAVSLTAAAEHARESARKAEFRDRMKQPGSAFKRPSLVKARKGRSHKLDPPAYLKTSTSAPLLVTESDGISPADSGDQTHPSKKVSSLEASLPTIGSLSLTAGKTMKPSAPIPKYRYFAEPWVSRSPNFEETEGEGLCGSLSGRQEDRSSRHSGRLPRMDNTDSSSTHIPRGPTTKYHYFSEAQIGHSPNYDMGVDGGWGGLCEARRTWSGLGKVVL